MNAGLGERWDVLRHWNGGCLVRVLADAPDVGSIHACTHARLRGTD